MVDDILKDAEDGMKRAIEAFQRDLSRVRTGRANLSLLDGIKVDYYGTQTPINQMAAIAVPDARLITIKPWDKSIIPTIERAIQAQSDLGLNPQSDGELVRVPIPPLTQERRKDMVKLVKKMAEDAKVAIRGGRRDANETLKAFADDGDISEDDQRKGQKSVQDLTDKYVATVDELTTKKEKEIMDV